MSVKFDITEELKEIERMSRAGVYGSEEFKRAFLITKGPEEPAQGSRISIEKLIDSVCARFKCTAEQLISGDKKRNVVDARAIVSRMAQLLNGLNLSDVSRALNKNNGTISRLANRAVKDPRLQRVIDELVETIS